MKKQISRFRNKADNINYSTCQRGNLNYSTCQRHTKLTKIHKSVLFSLPKKFVRLNQIPLETEYYGTFTAENLNPPFESKMKVIKIILIPILPSEDNGQSV
jgi:hypothetical protein